MQLMHKLLKSILKTLAILALTILSSSANVQNLEDSADPAMNIFGAALKVSQDSTIREIADSATKTENKQILLHELEGKFDESLYWKR